MSFHRYVPVEKVNCCNVTCYHLPRICEPFDMRCGGSFGCHNTDSTTRDLCTTEVESDGCIFTRWDAFSFLVLGIGQAGNGKWRTLDAKAPCHSGFIEALQMQPIFHLLCRMTKNPNPVTRVSLFRKCCVDEKSETQEKRTTHLGLRHFRTGSAKLQECFDGLIGRSVGGR